MRLLAVAAVLPAVLMGQDPANQAALDEWRRRQVVLADSQRVARQASSKQGQEMLADLEDDMNRVRKDMRDIGVATTTSGMSRSTRMATTGAPRTLNAPPRIFVHPDALLANHRLRVARVAQDDSSAAGLDSAYRSGDVERINGALAARYKLVHTQRALADSTVEIAQEVLTRAEESRKWALGENRPDADPDVKKALRIEIESAGRIARYYRALVQFESRWSKRLEVERASLESQMTAAAALRARQGSSDQDGSHPERSEE